MTTFTTDDRIEAENHPVTSWNYRLVRMDDDKWGDRWVEVREVFYEDGRPIGHTATTIMADDVGEVGKVLELIKLALGKPVLQPEEFIGAFTNFGGDTE